MATCEKSYEFMDVFGGSGDESDFEGFEDVDDDSDDENLDDIFGDDRTEILEPEAFPPVEVDCESYDDYVDTFLPEDDEEEDEDGKNRDGSGDGDPAESGEQWSTELHSYKPRAFSGPTPGPKRPLEATAKELDFFYLMFPPSLIELLAEETNRFAEQKRSDGNPDVRKWKPVSVDEMKVFLGIRVFMSLVPLPETRMYWKKDAIMGMFYVRNVMRAKRFKEISVNFCVNDQKKQSPEGDPNYDKLYEVRPVLDEVLTRCLLEYNPHPSCSIHASNIAYNFHSPQLMPRKTYNMQVLYRADSVSGYCCEFLVYVGEVNHEEGKKEPKKRFPSRMVTELCQKLQGFNYEITMSSYFTTPLLIKNLHSMDIVARGTVCRKLKGFPHALLSQTPVSKQGDCSVAQQGSMSAYAYAWCNRSVVRLISTADDPTDMTTLEWQERGKNKAVPYPRVLKEYNDSVGRMEKLEQLRVELPTARRSTRWWVYLFWCLFDIAVSNAFVLMKESQAHERFTCSGKRKTLKMRKFRENLSTQLMAYR